MKIVVHEQGSAPWLDWRLHGIGSSDAMVIAAHHGMIQKRDWMKSLNDLFDEKMSGIDRVVENDRMARGKKYEPVARRAFEAKTGIVVQPLCGEMDTTPELRASFDGITFDGLETIEIKVPDEKVHELAKAGEIVDYYLPQVCHQALAAWDVPSAWPAKAVANFGTYDPDANDLAVVRKPAVEYRDFAAELYRRELEFIEMLRSGVPPCGAEFASLAARYLSLDREIKRLSEARDKYDEALKAIAKQRGATVEGAGVSVIRQERTGTVNWKRLASEYSIADDEIEKYRGKGSVVWQTRTDKNAETPVVAVATDKTAAAQEVATIGDAFWGHFEQQSTQPRATHVTKAQRPHRTESRHEYGPQ